MWLMEVGFDRVAERPERGSCVPLTRRDESGDDLEAEV